MKKKVKKLFLACVTMTVLISCFCVTSFAKVGNGKIVDILEYYDTTKAFAFDSFDSAEDAKLLNVQRPESFDFRDGTAIIAMQASTNVSYVVPSLKDSFGANFRFRIDGDNVGRILLDIGDESETPHVVFAFDSSEGTTTYTLTDKNAMPITATIPDMILIAGTFYTLSTFYDKEARTVTLKLTEETDGGTESEITISTPDLTSASELALRLPTKVNNGVTVTLDYAEVYFGTFLRTFEEKQMKTEEAVLDLVNRYNTETTSDAEKEAIISTLHTLILSPAFTLTKGTLAYEALYGGASMGEKEHYTAFAVTFYTKKMIRAVEKIDTEKSYEERLAFVNEMNDIHDVILAVGMDDPDDDSEYGIALKKYHAESTAVEKIHTDAELFLHTLCDIVPARLDYAGYSDILKTLEGVHPDKTYPGVEACVPVYDRICALKHNAQEKASAFLSAVLLLADEEKTFATRYAAYTTARNSYYDDLSYFVVGEDGEIIHPVADAIALYMSRTQYFDDIVAYNESFLSFVSRAVYATERSSRLGCIMSAEKLMKSTDGNLFEIEYIRAGTPDKSVDYTNSVRCAVDKIEEMSQSIEADRMAIAEYIKAVNKLKAVGTIHGKKELLEQTRALRVADDLLTVDGVVEANIAFSSVEAEVVLWEGNSKLVLTSVAILKKTSDLSERAVLIMRARVALASLQDKTYEGVIDAETYLVQAVMEYNQGVAQMNEMFERETDAALDLSYAAAPKAIVGVIAWITKENY